jgi:hypothetical protein
MPAKLALAEPGAGIHGQCFDWIPASAGMTDFSVSDGKLARYPSSHLLHSYSPRTTLRLNFTSYRRLSLSRSGASKAVSDFRLAGGEMSAASRLGWPVGTSDIGLAIAPH